MPAPGKVRERKAFGNAAAVAGVHLRLSVAALLFHPDSLFDCVQASFPVMHKRKQASIIL